jgi:acyl-CoA thioesterase FadM
MDIEKKIIVGPTDTDSYNIIHHPQYFIWIEDAILEWLISTYRSLEQISYEIQKFQCKFISPGILYDDLLLQLNPKGKKFNNSDENIKFQVRIVKQKTKSSVIEADFFIRVKGKSDD